MHPEARRKLARERFPTELRGWKRRTESHAIGWKLHKAVSGNSIAPRAARPFLRASSKDGGGLPERNRAGSPPLGA